MKIKANRVVACGLEIKDVGDVFTTQMFVCFKSLANVGYVQLCFSCCPQDDKYWSRRKKNNVAAKRSRDARRLKENQITVRASFLERENAALRQQVAELRKDCGRCKNILTRYEAKYGPL